MAKDQKQKEASTGARDQGRRVPIFPRTTAVHSHTTGNLSGPIPVPGSLRYAQDQETPPFPPTGIVREETKREEDAITSPDSSGVGGPLNHFEPVESTSTGQSSDPSLQPIDSASTGEPTDPCVQQGAITGCDESGVRLARGSDR